MREILLIFARGIRASTTSLRLLRQKKVCSVTSAIFFDFLILELKRYMSSEKISGVIYSPRRFKIAVNFSCCLWLGSLRPKLSKSVTFLMRSNTEGSLLETVSLRPPINTES